MEKFWTQNFLTRRDRSREGRTEEGLTTHNHYSSFNLLSRRQSHSWPVSSGMIARSAFLQHSKTTVCSILDQFRNVECFFTHFTHH